MKVKTTGTLAAIALAVVCVLVIAFIRAVPVEFASPAERAKATWGRKLAARWNGLWQGVEAAAENVRLKRELAAAVLDRSEVESILAENDRLRRALDFKERASVSWVAAEVIAEGGAAAVARHSIRIGKGSLDGVRPDAPVVAPEGLVGRVASVTPHTAEVLLITDPAVQVACSVVGEKRLAGILSGGTEERLLLKHLKAGVEIAPQSKVLTSGLGGVFPAGIEVGAFVSEGAERNAEGRGTFGLEREGKVRPAVDFSLLEDVFVLK